LYNDYEIAILPDLAFLLIQREPLQGKKGLDHVSAIPLGLVFGPGSDPAVDVEPF
jgi:hypothetical protein